MRGCNALGLQYFEDVSINIKDRNLSQELLAGKFSISSSYLLIKCNMIAAAKAYG